jgi:hypothetical protein
MEITSVAAAAKYIDPYLIKDEDCPVFVSVCDIRGIVGFGIRERTGGNLNHSMIMRRAGYFASQNLLYKEIPLDSYVRKGVILKFWRCKDIKPFEKKLILNCVDVDLNASWFKRFYDFPGIIGQATGLRWINNPWRAYCSERTGKYASVIIPDLTGKRPNPVELDEAYQKSERMELMGVWAGV